MGKSPRKVEDSKPVKDDGKGKEKRSTPKKAPAASVIKLKMPEKADQTEIADNKSQIKPLKLTLKLSKPALEVAEPTTTKITPKLTLSLRKPLASSTVTDSSATQSTIPAAVQTEAQRKRGRKPKSLLSAASTDSASGNSSEHHSRKAIDSAPVSLATSKSSLSSSHASLPSVTQANKPPTTVYSEEDRLQRQIIGEILHDKVSKLNSHHQLWKQPVNSPDSLIKALWPFYEQLAVTEISNSLVFRQADVRIEDNQTVADRQNTEYASCLKKLQDLCFAEISVLLIFENHILLIVL